MFLRALRSNSLEFSNERAALIWLHETMHNDEKEETREYTLDLNNEPVFETEKVENAFLCLLVELKDPSRFIT